MSRKPIYVPWDSSDAQARADYVAASHAEWDAANVAELERLTQVRLDDPLTDAIFHALLRTQAHYIDIGRGDFEELARDLATDIAHLDAAKLREVGR